MNVIAELRRLGARRIKAEQEERALADQLRPLVAAAIREGVRPGEVAKLTGWSHAQVRNVARAAGLPPAKRGRAAVDNDATARAGHRGLTQQRG